MNKRLYAAYGSNLNFRQMRLRCPTAKLYKTGVIEGYELQFKGAPDNAYATIEHKHKSSVPVAVWEIGKYDEAALDYYEGYPVCYDKKNIIVKLDKKEVEAMVYVMNSKLNFGLPSAQYYETLLEGYKDCGLDISVLNKTLNDSVHNFYMRTVSESTQHEGVFGVESCEEDDRQERDEVQEGEDDEEFYLNKKMNF